jgi:GNAT superfamily N-acetyltransferase
MNIIYQTTLPPSDQYFSLFESTGWNDEYRATPDALMSAVSNSQYVVCAYEGGQLIGFGRILTDGILHAMIYEMIVHPAYQGRGIGKQILGMLVQWCQEAHIRDIQLFCAGGKRGFYEKYGFVTRPEDAPGMQYCHSLA